MSETLRGRLAALRHFKLAEGRMSLPLAPEVGYTGPNGDGSRKCCGNCVHWVADETCDLYAPDQVIRKLQVCNAHMYTAAPPKTEREHHKQVTYLDETSGGLVETRDGSSCDVCVHSHDGVCDAVERPRGTPLKVEAKACCTRWSQSDE